MSAIHRTARAIFIGLFVCLTMAASGLAAAVSWTYLGGPYGGQPSTLYSDAASNTWAGMNSAGVYYRAAGSAQWALRPGMPTQGNSRFAIGGTGTVYVSGTSGVYALVAGGATWQRVSGANGLPGQAGSGMTSDAQGAVYVAMNNTGNVYKLAAGGTTWTAVGSGLPSGSAANNLVFDGAGNLWASVYGAGVFKLSVGGATWVATNGSLDNLNVQALAIVGNDLFAGNQFHGAYKLANARGGGANWVPLNGGSLNAGDAIYAFAVSAGNTLYAAGYGAVHALASGATSWTAAGNSLSAYGPTYSIAWSSADGALTVGNGSGIFVLPAGGSAWQFASQGMTASTVDGLVIAGNGDLYAATSGQGVQRLAAGTSVWTAVDPANTSTSIRAIAIDGQGTVFVSSNGTVKKLAGGTWSAAGTDQGSSVRALAVDGANAVWSGQSGAVRKLSPGAAAWFVVGTGLPSNKDVDTLAIDGIGTAYAGIQGTGVYMLVPGSASWTSIGAGLPDVNLRTLARGADGTMLAGTNDGVYRFVGGAWQKVGTGLSETVYAVAADANGDLYAGVDDDYAWRLVVGSAAWTQVKLGLGSREVTALAVGGGRVYAGTDSGRGSPSGVYVFVPLDSVVEFYNTNLDNYFITANPVEQAAIGNGSAGPGWSTTGDFFNAGGASLVCRFYGSLTPGPNSHFYTIDPAECQTLKDVQAATSATEKRWNFESNDFASTAPMGGQCAAGLVPVYRAYNNGFARGVDSNHRITANYAAYLAQVAKGWAGEGIVMCAPAR